MIDDLVVRADARRRGAATALLTAALAGFAAEGLETASLWMQPGSEPAMRLYEGWGFSVTGTLLVRHEGPDAEG
jgi:ribosomal protein S18 acetylase RimI-like enzyme